MHENKEHGKPQSNVKDHEYKEYHMVDRTFCFSQNCQHFRPQGCHEGTHCVKSLAPSGEIVACTAVEPVQP